MIEPALGVALSGETGRAAPGGPVPQNLHAACAPTKQERVPTQRGATTGCAAPRWAAH